MEGLVDDICRYGLEKGKYRRTPGLYEELTLGCIYIIMASLRSGKDTRSVMYLCLRKYFTFCRGLVSFRMVSQGDFASILYKRHFKTPSVKINCMSLLVDYELGFGGGVVITLLIISVSISAKRFSCVARTEYSFLLFSLSCKMELRGALM